MADITSPECPADGGPVLFLSSALRPSGRLPMGRGVFICPSLPGQQRPGNLHREIMGKRIRDFLSMEIASGGDSQVKPQICELAERLGLGSDILTCEQLVEALRKEG